MILEIVFCSAVDAKDALLIPPANPQKYVLKTRTGNLDMHFFIKKIKFLITADLRSRYLEMLDAESKHEVF